MHAIATNQLDLDNPSKRSDISPPTPIRFELKGENLADIALATTSHVKVISQHELRVEAYQGFGKGLQEKTLPALDLLMSHRLDKTLQVFTRRLRPDDHTARVLPCKRRLPTHVRECGHPPICWYVACEIVYMQC